MLSNAALCKETVSILQAVLFGVDGACVDINLMSLLGGVALFIGLVVLLRLIGSTLLRRAFPFLRRQKSTIKQESAPQTDEGLQRMPYESPIRSTGAWGHKPR